MDALRICLFGRIRVAHGESACEARMTPGGQKLLAFLLLQPHRCLPREALVDLAWGDRPESQARGALNTALFRLRHVLEPSGVASGTYLLTMPGGEVGFNWDSQHWLDLTIFEQTAERALAVPGGQFGAAEARQLESVLPLYAGDLLEGLYDDWALRERERLRLVYLSCLACLMRYHERRGDYADGLRYGEMILRHDPLREEIHRRMIRMHLAAGHRPQALRQYEQCREVLLRELGIAPMPETQALCSEMTASGAHPTLPGDVDGLAPALDQLTRALDAFDHASSDLRQAVRKLEAVTARRSSPRAEHAVRTNHAPPRNPNVTRQ